MKVSLSIRETVNTWCSYGYYVLLIYEKLSGNYSPWNMKSLILKICDFVLGQKKIYQAK